MTIIERLEREAKRHPGGAGEGIRIALRVLDQCNCGTCAHLGPSANGELFVECTIGGIDDPDEEDDFCSRWEPRK